MIDGLLTEVIETTRGSQATATVAVGGTEIPVDDVTDFPDTGGQVDICGARLDYTAATAVDAGLGDDGVPVTSGTLTLADPLAAQVDEDDPVLLVVGTDVATDAYAIIDIPAGDDTDAPDGGDSIQVPIAYDQRASFPVGPYEPAVPVQVEDDLSAVITVPGVKPVIDGGSIVNLPESGGPTEAPESSPTPTLLGNIRTILGSLTPVPGATAYDLHLLAIDPDAEAVVTNADGSITVQPPADPVDDTNLNSTTTASQFQISHGPDITTGGTDAGTGTGTGTGTALTADAATPGSLTNDLQPETDYWVAIVARNSIGAADPSPWTGPVQLRAATNVDIAADYVYAGDVTADQITAGTLSAVVNLAGQFTTRADENSPGGELDATGLKGYAQDPDTGETVLEVDLPFDGRSAYFAGDVAARKLTAYQGADFYGDANNVKADGGLYLESGSGTAGVAAPTVTQTVPSILIPSATYKPSWLTSAVSLVASQCYSFTWDPTLFNGAGGFVTQQHLAGGNIRWGISLSGQATALNELKGWWSWGYVRGTGSAYAELWTDVTSASNCWVSGPGGSTAYTRLNTSDSPAMGISTDGYARIVERPAGTKNFRVQAWTMTGTPALVSQYTTTTNLWTAGTIGSISYGQFDLAANRMVMTPRASAATNRIINNGTTGAEVPGEEWTMPVGMIGVARNALPQSGAGTQWVGLGTDRRLYFFTANTWAAATTSRWVAAVTQATATSESQVGDKVAFTMNKRWQVTVTSPALVQPATRAGIYLWRGASGLPTDAQLVRQGFSPNGSRALTITAPVTSGTAPGGAPTSDPYPVVSPAFAASQATDADGSLVRLGGDGSWRLGPLAATPAGALIGGTDQGPLLRLQGLSSASGASIANAAWTTITSWVENFGNPYLSALSGGVGTIAYAGLYLVTAGVSWATAASGRRILRITQNGTEIVRTDTTAAGNVSTQQTQGFFAFAVGDTVACQVYQNSGAAVALGTAPSHVWQLIRLAPSAT